MARIMIGASDGLTLRYEGGLGRPVGNSPAAALIALCTSRAAPLMSRLRSNWMVTLEPPNELTEVISETPAICEKRRSSGAASDDAAVSGSTPGSCALTLIVGKSTFGNGATGRKW